MRNKYVQGRLTRLQFLKRALWAAGALLSAAIPAPLFAGTRAKKLNMTPARHYKKLAG